MELKNIRRSRCEITWISKAYLSFGVYLKNIRRLNSTNIFFITLYRMCLQKI